MEEFTSEKCGNCPSAVQMFEGVMAEASMKDKIIPICHHSGYQEDWLCSQADRDYVWFYGGSSGNFAPAFMIDRANSKANDYNRVVSPPKFFSSASALKSEINSRYNAGANTSVNLRCMWNQSKNQIQVKVTGKRKPGTASDITRLTLVLTEDGIRPQSSSFSTHNHVTRAVNSSFGTAVNWSNNTYSYTYTFTVNSNWSKNNLKVVAFLSAYDSTAPAKCIIDNANIKTPAEYSPNGLDDDDNGGGNDDDPNPGGEGGGGDDIIIIIDTAVDNINDATAEVKEFYTLEGRRLNQPQKGLNIAKMKDGSTKKLIVK